MENNTVRFSLIIGSVIDDKMNPPENYLCGACKTAIKGTIHTCWADFCECKKPECLRRRRSAPET